MNTLSEKPERIAVRLTRSGERSLRSGHPWIFSDSIEQLKSKGKAGDIAVIFGRRRNRVIGIGLYDPASPIRIKILHSGGAKTIDYEFFRKQIVQAFNLRRPLLLSKTNAYRLIYGENDGFPGLIADIYDKVLVVKLYSAIWFPYIEDISAMLAEVSGAKTGLIRMSRLLKSLPDKPFKEGDLLFGHLESEEVVFEEHGVRFCANLVKGHKTGFFLDHRHNRKRVGELAAGRTVLDVFSYSGGFSVHALKGGASEVTTFDISQQALDAARRNAELNDHQGEHTLVSGNAFDLLEDLYEQGKRYGLVVIDPPSFAKEKSQEGGAMQKYRWLVRKGAGLCRKEGILVMASCSSRVSAEHFFKLIETELLQTGRAFGIVEKSRHDIDHPVSFPEGDYLKCSYIHFRD